MSGEGKIPDAIIEPPEKWGDALPEEQYTVTGDEYVINGIKFKAEVAKRKQTQFEYEQFYERFVKGELDLEKIIIFFKNELIETEKEMNAEPDIIFKGMIKIQKTEIENYLARIDEVSGRTKKPNESEPVKTGNQTATNSEVYDSLPESIKSQLNYLFSEYPMFKKYFPVFLGAEYIEIKADYIQWKKSKVALTKFVKHFAGTLKCQWSKYEKLFSVESLRTAEGAYPEKICIEFDELVKKVDSESK